MAVRRRKTRNSGAWLVVIVVMLAIVLGVIAVTLYFKGGIGPSGNETSIPAASVQEISSAASVTAPSSTPASSEEEASSAATVSKIPAVIPDGEFVTPKGFTVVTKNGISTVDGVLIVNKTYSIPANYTDRLSATAKAAFDRMVEAAKEEMGYDLYILKGGGGDFRSYDYQKSLYDYRVSTKGKERADIVSARPGHSEHETGLAIDVVYADSSIEPPEEIVWMDNNCWRFGFILRYPEGKTDETGYIYEPWHIRYLGDVEFAEELYNDGDWITLEDYFGLTSVYAD